MSLLDERRGLLKRVLSFVDLSLAGAPSESFETLALELHAFQARHDPVVRALAEAAPVDDWLSIPAVPVALFKDLPVGTVGDGEAGTEFRTSGTTGGGRGIHRLRDTMAYDRGAQAWHQRCVPDAPQRVVGLLQDPAIAPDSSLSHMVAGFGTVSWWLGPEGLDVSGALGAMSGEVGVYLCATAFALAELLETLPVPRPLPPGSVVMVTGGFKGRRQVLSDQDLYRQTQDLLAPERLLREYGMTELSSQLWAAGMAPYRPPPWLRVVAVDPATGRPRPAGRAGQLRFVDLCNVDATVAIETLDEGVVHPDGSLTLHGRLAGSEVRGCSLTVEELRERTGAAE